jgi:hypothetical protein
MPRFFPPLWAHSLCSSMRRRISIIGAAPTIPRSAGFATLEEFPHQRPSPRCPPTQAGSLLSRNLRRGKRCAQYDT